MTFCKYSFPSQEIWGRLKETITNQEGGFIDCAVVELGHLCLEKDEEGKCISYEESISVDIMWYGDIPESFNEYEVFPNPCGVHTFAGCDYLYIERYNQMTNNI